MKTLTKIRLINWHYFTDETILIKGNTLLTGQNASGKSTILDAISFVLSAGDQNFNIAANDKGKRDLRGYVKCKLGSIDQKYLRDYDLSSHICLEFFSEKTEKFFCLGAIIDVAGEMTPPKILFYIIDSPMNEKYFIVEKDDKKVIRNIQDFKKEEFTPYLFTTKKEAKTAFRTRLGGISERYFQLLPKALAFKPINNVKEYIYQHLLLEKNIDVSTIKQSITSFKELEGILKVTKEKIEELKIIKERYSEIDNLKDNQEYYQYLLKTIDKLELTNKINQQKVLLKGYRADQNGINEKIKDINNEISSKEKKANLIYNSLYQNIDFRNLQIYDKDIEVVSNNINYLNEKNKEYERRVDEINPELNYLATLNEDLEKEIKKIDFNFADKKEAEQLIKDLNTLNDNLNKERISLNSDYIEIRNQKKDIVNIMNKHKSQLDILKSNNVSHDETLLEVRKKMQEYLKQKYGENISVHILSDLLSLKDPSWQESVEKYLGKLRFSLVVEPRYYDDCLQVYNNIKSNKVYGINIINTKKIQGFTSYKQDSLASIIQTENKDARCFINFFCGELIMVNSVFELEYNAQSITKDGMLYKGFVTKYLNPNNLVPFIGINAATAQKEKVQQEFDDIKEEYQYLSQQEDNINKYIESIQKLDLSYLVSLIDEIKQIFALRKELIELENKKNSIQITDEDSLKQEYENIKNAINDLIHSKEGEMVNLGIKQQEIDQTEKNILNFETEIININKNIKDIEDKHIDFKEKCENEIEQYLKENDENEVNELIKEKIHDELGDIENFEKNLIVLQTQYISKYNKPFKIGIEGIDSYLEEYDKLVKSELVNCENKVRESRENVERLFKEDFLYKLRSYILEAQEEIKKINETLDKITFGKDKYQFTFLKSKEFTAIYEAIMSETIQMVDQNDFQTEFENKYRQELDILFENLSNYNESLGTINKYTDYRTYMDYDIKIISGNNKFYFSDISSEKSGGETQIPFYVAILASFVKLFEQAEKNCLDDSVGLIIFDEVFDKMDTPRTDAMMKFIANLKVQILFACPPQKMESLQKHTDTCIVVHRNEKHATTIPFIENKN